MEEPRYALQPKRGRGEDEDDEPNKRRKGGPLGHYTNIVDFDWDSVGIGWRIQSALTLLEVENANVAMAMLELGVMSSRMNKMPVLFSTIRDYRRGLVPKNYNQYIKDTRKKQRKVAERYYNVSNQKMHQVMNNVNLTIQQQNEQYRFWLNFRNGFISAMNDYDDLQDNIRPGDPPAESDDDPSSESDDDPPSESDDEPQESKSNENNENNDDTNF